MALDKAIEHGREQRRPYRGAKAVDPACRNHGSDEWAVDNRLHAARMNLDAVEDRIREWQEEISY